MFAAINTLKPKSAAFYYETNICFAYKVGGQIGGLGLGRKQFTEILMTMEVIIDQKATAYICTPLPNTHFPPHF